MTQTHESYVQAVAALVTARLNKGDRAKLDGVKLVYGAGAKGLRGVTYYGRWQGPGDVKANPFVEVCAFGQEDWVQLAGTTIHELGHVLAGWEAGHGNGWKEACARLGLRNAQAAGHAYQLECFEDDVREGLEAIPKPEDGSPVDALIQGLAGGAAGKRFRAGPRGCAAGVGTRGGKSQGVGSGSRYRLYSCECVPAVKVRHAGDALQAKCLCCKGLFTKR